jgi:hypothetical protein
MLAVGNCQVTLRLLRCRRYQATYPNLIVLLVVTVVHCGIVFGRLVLLGFDLLLMVI